MKYSFDNKYKEDSFLKTRTETLSLPQDLKNRLSYAGVRTTRSLVNQTTKDLNKTAGSNKNAALLISALDRLALEIQLTENTKISTTERTDDLEFEKSQLLLLSEFGIDADNDIIGTFAEYFKIDRKDIISDSRQQDLVYVRGLIVWVLREHAGMSFPAIGKLLGNRDHTTIIHSYRKLKDKFNSDQKLHSALDELITKAKAIKERKTHIEEKLIPELIASIHEKQLKKKRSPKFIEISERDLKVLELYREGLTLQELGNASGVTRERARQIVEKTIRQMALNDSILSGTELDANIILEEEKKKRATAKNKGKIIIHNPIKEKTWSRYYLSCKSCGTIHIPHVRQGLCEKCIGQYRGDRRENIISRHQNKCDSCQILRHTAIKELGRDFYITKDQKVLCKKCFLSNSGKSLGGYKNYPWSRFYANCASCGTTSTPHHKKGLCEKCSDFLASKEREKIISSHGNKCNYCGDKRGDVLQRTGKDLYVLKNKSVACQKCFFGKIFKTKPNYK